MVDEDGKEVFLVRTMGGPHPGTRYCSEGSNWGVVISWPLPEFFKDEGGKYVKTSESQLPPILGSQHVARAAQYEWVADE